MFKLFAIVLVIFIGHSLERPVKSTSLSNAINKFNLNLLQNLYNENENVFFSPFSISSAFGMLYAGAKGQTAQELREVLGYESAKILDEQIYQQFSEVLTNIEGIDSNKYELNVANKLVVQKDFEILKSYEENLKNYFKTTIDSVDFADSTVANSINQWVSSLTHDKIKKLLDGPLSSATRLVLLNAVYFKGLFQTQFLKNQTKEEVFFNGGNAEKNTQMMIRTGKFNYTEIEEIDSKLLEIPYTGDDISLYILLPNQKQGLKAMNSGLSSWSQIEDSISRLRAQEVEVTVPKFKIETSYSLKQTLSKMGMHFVFSSSADLSGIDGKRDLDVSEVIHKAFVEVNEEGTEAAAATAIIIKALASVHPSSQPVFRADHPFMFFIRDNKNGITLFAGHINQL
jgi:serpin B